MKLTSFRIKDRMHQLDLIDAGLIDEIWCSRLPEVLQARLRQLLQNPEIRNIDPARGGLSPTGIPEYFLAHALPGECGDAREEITLAGR